MTLLLALAALAAACGPGDIGTVDAGDDVDGGGSGIGGITVRWTAPAIGTLVDDVTIERLRLQLADVRVIGDAGPGEGTYLASSRVDLHDTERPTLEFRAAPPGRYSAFEFGLERESDGMSAWDLEGTVDLGSETLDLEVDDEASSQISLPLGALDLAAGQTVEVTIEIDLAAVVSGVDWTMATIEDETVVVEEDDDPLLIGMRQRLRGAFLVQSIVPID